MAESDNQVLAPAGVAVDLVAQRPTAHIAKPMDSDEMQAWWRTAEAMAASQAFKQTDAALAFVKITLGRDLGLGPAQAMMSLDVVKGNLQMRGTLLASFVKQSDRYDYERVESDNDHCVVDFFGISKRTGEWTLLGREEFSIEDAERAGLVKADSNWKAWPRNMCFWRCISNGVKMHCPDLLGGVPVYTEADDFREVPAIGAAESDAAPGWKGVSVADAAEVEKVVRRAERLGHKGLANLAAAQMALNDQPSGLVQEWVRQAHGSLDSLATTPTPDAPEGEPESPQSEEEGRVDDPEIGAQGYAVPEGPTDSAPILEHRPMPEGGDKIESEQQTLTEPEAE